MKLEGRLTISRTQSNFNSDQIEIAFTDYDSGIDFVVATVSPEVFALSLTGLSHLPCELEVEGLAYVGKMVENKVEKVAYENFRISDEMAEALAKPFEIDGWIYTRASWRTYDGMATLYFRRYVDKD